MIDPRSSLKQLGEALRLKKISSVELTTMYLDRLEKLGRKHRAVAELTAQLALKQAKAADESPKSSPLHGIPYGAKDLLATKGIPTRWGSRGHDRQVFDYDATVVSKLERAGAVLVAKLSMIELAGGGNYDIAGASMDGACLSAWDDARWAGGSSSGSGAATALGCVGFSIGTETWGSIICPSSFNGATGFRPTYGRVSRYGAMACAWTMDRIGPICRSAEDCALVLSAIAGKDERDPSTLSGKLRFSDAGAKPRIGLVKETFADAKAEACEKAYQSAIEQFKKLGYEFVDVKFPDLPYGQAGEIIIDCECASAHENFIRGPRFNEMADHNQIGNLAAALTVPAVDYLWALKVRQEAQTANEVWEKCDCIFTPTFYHQAPPIAKNLADPANNWGGGDDGPAHILGWPTMAFPFGFEAGNPIGAQILGPAGGEATCFRVARDFQRATDFHLLKPTHA